ncbi:hypothetical protein JCM3765_006677 [Sporobolomyces pararoseus]
MASSDSSRSAHPALLKLLPPPIKSQHVSIRVRTDKKMNNLITLSLSSLRDKAELPIILHSFPSPPSSSTSAVKETISSNSVDSIPKLVSTVEVIKREYGKFISESTQPTSQSNGKGKGKAVEDTTEVDTAAEAKEAVNSLRREGLHQYSMLTTFESLGFDTTSTSTSKASEGKQGEEKSSEVAEFERQELIKMAWLTGKAGKDKRPKVKHTPCMVIVLSTRKIKELETSNSEFTYQSPLPLPKASKPESKRPAPTETEGEKETTKPKRRRRRGKGKKKSTTTTTTTTEQADGKENEGEVATEMAVDQVEEGN